MRAADYDLLWDHLVVHTPAPRGEVIFCFGSRDLGVPRRAAELHRAGVARSVLVSGGDVPGFGSEAEAFAEVLTGLGVPPDDVVVEPSATHTGENVVLGMRRLAEVGIVPQRVVLVSWPFSSRRGAATFARHHPDVAVDTVPSGPPPGRRWPATERTVRSALGEYDRLRRYGGIGHLRHEPVPRPVAAAAERLRAALSPAATPILELATEG
jgi:hypothetical protein